MKRLQVKIGARVGGGPEPGHQWAVEYLSVAATEARKFLTDCQYAHVVEQVIALADEEDPTHPLTVSVDAVNEFWELRDKGGPLGKINIRVFFIIEHQRRTVVILGVIKKENDGKTPVATTRVIDLRRRKFLNGDYGRAE